MYGFTNIPAYISFTKGAYLNNTEHDSYIYHSKEEHSSSGKACSYVVFQSLLKLLSAFFLLWNKTRLTPKREAKYLTLLKHRNSYF